jgi:hypothetical protein
MCCLAGERELQSRQTSFDSLQPHPCASDIRASVTTLTIGNVTCTVDVDWAKSEQTGATAVAFDVILQVVSTASLMIACCHFEVIFFVEGLHSHIHIFAFSSLLE